MVPPKDPVESVELFDLRWRTDSPRKDYAGEGALDALSLSDTDIELLQMGLSSLIRDNTDIAQMARRNRHKNPWPLKADEIDIIPILEGTAGEAQELLNRLIMLVGRNVGEDGW